MQSHHKFVVTTLIVPLLMCPGCTGAEPSDSNSPPGTWTGAGTGAGTGTTTGSEETTSPPTGTVGETTSSTTDMLPEPPDGPREPISNSVLSTFVDENGETLPGAWVRVLATPPTPGAAPRSQLPSALTADSGGNILVEALGTGEQRWMIGAPGFVTRTEVFSLPAGTRTHSTFRLTRKGKTFAFHTDAAMALEHENVKVELPAGYMVNRRTGERVTGEVLVTVTVVNPTADSEDAPPVRLIGRDLLGDSGNLVSFGMVGVELTSPDGARLELNEDVAAKVSFLLSPEQSAQVDLLGAKVIPAWHADPEEGETEWEEVGVFFLSEKDAQGRYTVTTHAIKKFSWINTDIKSLEPRCYVIKVLDPQKQPVVGQKVKIGNYGGFTGDDGAVCIEFAVGTQFPVSIPNEPPVIHVAEMAHPKAVCTENPWPWYKDYPHGVCTEIIIHLNNNDVCVPGSTWDCSDEPGKNLDPMLDGVGTCKSAYRLCADGSAWSECFDPVRPEQEICCYDPNDPNTLGCNKDVQLNEDCDKELNEKENNPPNNCVPCSPGMSNICYTGNPSDLETPQTACKPGLQFCDNGGEWGMCATDADMLPPDAQMVTPNLAMEDCDPANGVESCTDKPCDFDPLWWHSMGAEGKHVNLAAHLAGNHLTSITQVTDGDTASYGQCFKGVANPLDKVGFSGVTLGKYLVTDQDPLNQSCSDPNIIEGKIDTVKIRADAGAKGTAVSGLTTGIVLADLNSFLNGCEKQIPMGTQFVSRFSSKNACLFRVAADGPVVIRDVAVGTTASDTYVALSVPANNQPVNLSPVGGMPIPGCTFPAGVERSYFVKLSNDFMGVKCVISNPYPGEIPLAIDVDHDMGGSLSMVYRLGNDIKLRQLNGVTFAPVWPDPGDPTQIQAALATVIAGGSTFEPSGIAANGQRIAVTGNFTGTITSYGKQFIAQNNDFVLLVADNVKPDRGVSLVGSGQGAGDKGDFGGAVQWVTYIDPVSFETAVGLVVAGNSLSKDFSFGNCWQEVNPDDNGTALDSFVGVLKYTDGVDPDPLKCADHHVLTGLGDQNLSSITVSDMRVGVCGYHNKAIKVGNIVVEDFVGNDKNAHCGFAVLPVRAPM